MRLLPEEFLQQETVHQPRKRRALGPDHGQMGRLRYLQVKAVVFCILRPNTVTI